MKSDEFSRALQKRVTQLRKISRQAVGDHHPVTSLVKAEIATELQMQLDNYRVWMGWKITGSGRKK